MKKYPRFETPRLFLRPFKFSDAPIIQKIVSEPEVLESLPDLPNPYSIADAEDWIATHPFVFAESGDVHMALCLKSDEGSPVKTGNNSATGGRRGGSLEETLMGAVGLCSREAGRGEIGFWLGKAHQGKGYAGEAISPVLQYGFQELRLKTISAEVQRRNKASQRVLEKAGFKFDARRLPGQPDFRSTDAEKAGENIKYILQVEPI